MSTVQNNRKARRPLAYGLAAAVALGTLATGVTSTANAAPLSVNQAALKQAVPENIVDVHRRYRSGHVVAGLALGIIGAAIAHKAYKHHYRHNYYYGGYGGPYYSYGYYGPPSCIRRHGLVYCR